MSILDTRLDWDAINAVAGSADVSHQTPETPQPDPLADLLATPIRRLTAPLAVASTILADTIFLVANDAQAAAVRVQGGIPYTPPEISLLWELHEAVRPEVWAERLRRIHDAKKRFDGRILPGDA